MKPLRGRGSSGNITGPILSSDPAKERMKKLSRVRFSIEKAKREISGCRPAQEAARNGWAQLGEMVKVHSLAACWASWVSVREFPRIVI